MNEAIAVLRGDADDRFRLADPFTGIALQNAAAYALELGDVDGARRAAREALVEARRAGLPNWIAVSIQHLATVAAIDAQAAVAARLCGWVDAIFTRDGATRGYTEQRTYEILQGALAGLDNETELARMRIDGEALTQDEAVAMAFAVG